MNDGLYIRLIMVFNSNFGRQNTDGFLKVFPINEPQASGKNGSHQEVTYSTILLQNMFLSYVTKIS